MDFNLTSWSVNKYQAVKKGGRPLGQGKEERNSQRKSKRPAGNRGTTEKHKTKRGGITGRSSLEIRGKGRKTEEVAENEGKTW